MQWEHLNQQEFCEAVRDTQLCIVPMGVLERHGDHMPNGTDCFAAHYVACEAAKREAAVVFPVFYFGQSNESRAFPGNISVSPALVWQLLEQLLDEIARNGFKKILLYSWHGGNTHLTHLLAQSSLWQEKKYSLYVYEMDDDLNRQIRQITGEDPNHAAIWETSVIMALYPEDVDLTKVPAKRADPLGRLSDLRHAYSGYGWYADYPENYTDDAGKANAQLGRELLEAHIRSLCECIASVKRDRMTEKLQEEFQSRAAAPAADAFIRLHSAQSDGCCENKQELE